MAERRSPTRADRSAARRREFYQDRCDRAGRPVDVIAAGVGYLTSVIRRLELVDPRKAEQVATDTTEFLLRQANAHDKKGGRR